MKKIKFQLMLLLAGLFVFYSCDVEDTATIEVPVSSLSIDLEDIVVGNDDPPMQQAKSSIQLKSTLNSFFATQTISLENLPDFKDVAKYKSQIKSVSVGSASVTISTTDENGTVVEKFVLEANNIGNLEIPIYELGTNYAADEIQNFATQILLKLFNGDVTLTASGKTDVISGENLKISITLQDIMLVAYILKNGE